MKLLPCLLMGFSLCAEAETHDTLSEFDTPTQNGSETIYRNTFGQEVIVRNNLPYPDRGVVLERRHCENITLSDGSYGRYADTGMLMAVYALPGISAAESDILVHLPMYDSGEFEGAYHRCVNTPYFTF